MHTYMHAYIHTYILGWAPSPAPRIDPTKNEQTTGKGTKKSSVLHGPFLMPKVVVFVVVLLSFVNSVRVLFFWKWLQMLQSSKKE